jgi:hypothetical protein
MKKMIRTFDKKKKHPWVKHENIKLTLPMKTQQMVIIFMHRQQQKGILNVTFCHLGP